MVLNGPLTTEDVDKALALRSFSGGGSGPTGPTGPGVGAQGPTGPAGPAGPTGPTASSGLTQTNSAVLGSTALSGSAATIIGGAINITVPAGGGRVIISAACTMEQTGGGAAAFVTMEALIDGVVVEIEFASVPGSSSIPIPLVFRSNALTAGTHTVDLQALVAGGAVVAAANASLVTQVVTV